MGMWIWNDVLSLERGVWDTIGFPKYEKVGVV